MGPAQGQSPLARLRAAYAGISDPDKPSRIPEDLDRVLAAARGDKSSTAREREELELIDAKIDMRRGDRSGPSWDGALVKFKAFLKESQNPDYRSEARGWIAHIYYERGNQTAAGKIYLDELNGTGSNLSYKTILNSLRMTYGYDGGPALLQHIDE